MSATMTCSSHAKINLYLDVLARRRDGYHNIETIFQTISLSDRLAFEECSGGTELECSRADLSCGPENIVFRAASLLRERTGCTRGVRIRLDKRIPIAAGLAGGSGNAAATLIALNDVWGLGLSRQALHQLARRLGADVPYCLEGGTVAATGRGDALTRLDPLPETWLVLVHPPFGISTRTIYASRALTHSTERPFAGRTRAFRSAIEAVGRGDVAGAVFNRMEPCAFEMRPELADLKRQLLAAGCAAAAMSGSGPTLFGLCGSRGEAERIAHDLPGLATSVVCGVPCGIVRGASATRAK